MCRHLSALLSNGNLLLINITVEPILQMWLVILSSSSRVKTFHTSSIRMRGGDWYNALASGIFLAMLLGIPLSVSNMWLKPPCNAEIKPCKVKILLSLVNSFMSGELERTMFSARVPSNILLPCRQIPVMVPKHSPDIFSTGIWFSWALYSDCISPMMVFRIRVLPVPGSPQIPTFCPGLIFTIG